MHTLTHSSRAFQGFPRAPRAMAQGRVVWRNLNVKNMQNKTNYLYS